MPTAPSDESMTFLIAEGVRPETGGKLTIVGFYGGGNILVPEETEETNLASLALIFIFKDGEGRFATHLTINAPSGNPIAELNMRDTVIQEGKTHTIVAQLTPFTAREYGRYEVLLRLNEHRYSRSFSLNRSPEIRPL
jgi:hypothetical protein